MKHKQLFAITLAVGLFLSLAVGSIGYAQEAVPKLTASREIPNIETPHQNTNKHNTIATAAFSDMPDYDSGWVALNQNQTKTLSHNLGGNPDDYVVDMQYKSDSSGINQRYYGGADFGATAFGGTRENDRVGAYWRSLTASAITVYRRPEDDYAPQVRIRIWVKPTPDYDSGWVALNQNQTKTLSHNLGGNPDDYVVDMQYKSDSSGINQRYYGGADFGATAFGGTRENDRVGAYWRSLTASAITVYRRPEDDYAPQVRIRIWVTHYQIYLPLVIRN